MTTTTRRVFLPFCFALVAGSPANSFQFSNVAPIGRSCCRRTESRQRPTGFGDAGGNRKPVFSGFESLVSLRSATKADSTEQGGADLDTDALVKYFSAATIEMTLFTGAFKLLDLAVEASGVTIPLPAVGFLFYAISLKSRVFNPLNNDRPDRTKDVEGEGSAGFKDRVMPKFTPPGFIFPIVWLLIMSPLRAVSSAMVYGANGNMFCHPALLSLVLHLTVGDVWNTINNAERRYGASVIGVLCVLCSAAFAAVQYYQVDPLAGKLLGATMLWLVTASTLITQTWRLNPLPSGELDPLYPVKGDIKTEFAWFSGKGGDE